MEQTGKSGPIVGLSKDGLGGTSQVRLGHGRWRGFRERVLETLRGLVWGHFCCGGLTETGSKQAPRTGLGGTGQVRLDHGRWRGFRERASETLWDLVWGHF